jgi:OOP family OmpA-OmpF porin
MWRLSHRDSAFLNPNTHPTIMNLRSIGIAALTATTLPSLAFASPPEGDAPSESTPPESTSTESIPVEGEAVANIETATVTPEAQAEVDEEWAKRRRHLPWIHRWAPEKSIGELGIFGGAFFPSPRHELFYPDRALPDQGFKPLARVAPEVGVRLGYYPLRWLGFEFEGAVMPARLAEVADPAMVYSARGHAVFQLGLWSITPFLLVGGGGLGIASDNDVLGNDIDPMVHFGGGVKFYLNRYIMLRLEARDVISHKQGEIEYLASHNPEVLVGLTFTLGREKDKPPAKPPVVSVSDRDADGFADDLDRCPDLAETINAYQDDDGCPELDSDSDTFWDEQDTCPNEAETVNAYQDDDGCPEADRDGDGFWDDQDSCPDEAETANGYQDQDGCADELPEAVKAFTGVIKGITFDTNKDTIRKSSFPTLDRAVDVLSEHPDVRIQVIGHTDNTGERDHNIELSQRRAESVKTYLVERGIKADRITTDGVGPDQPLETNDTKAGRANNRRIEFKIIQQEGVMRPEGRTPPERADTEPSREPADTER